MGATSNLRRAESVLAEAKSYGVIDSLPEDEKDRIKMADELIQRARVAHDQFHNREPMVLSILFAADVDGGTASGTKPESGYSEEIEEPYPDYDKLTISEIKESVDSAIHDPDRLTEIILRYEKHGKNRPTLIKWLEEKLEEDSPREEAPQVNESEQLSDESEREEWPEPQVLEELPEDFTTLSDLQVRQLHSKFNAMAARYGVLLVKEENMVQDCKVMADARRNQLISDHPDKSKIKSVAMLDAEISADEELVKWRGRQYNHEKNVRVLKMQRDISNTNVDRLSREWTMRSEERNGSGHLMVKIPPAPLRTETIS